MRSIPSWLQVVTRTWRAASTLLRMVWCVFAIAVASVTTSKVADAGCASAFALPPGAPIQIPASPAEVFSYAAGMLPRWSAVGIRPVAGVDWDLDVGPGGLPPGCQTSLLASSLLGVGIPDLVVTDFNHAPPTTLAARAFRVFGAGGAILEQDQSQSAVDLLTPDGTMITRQWAPDRVLECWDMPLEGGRAYTIHFIASANVRLLVFRNPGTGLYAAGRNAALLETASSTTFTPSEDNVFAAVVVKLDDQPASFELGVGDCDPTYLLGDGEALGFANLGQARVQISPTHGRWAVVGFRHDLEPLTIDWNLALSGTAPAPWPECAAPTVKLSEDPEAMDYFVVDFRHTPPGPHRLRAYRIDSGPSATLRFENSGPARTIAVNAPATVETVLATTLFFLREVYLVQGQTYLIELQGNSNGIYLYGNPSDGEYWGNTVQALAGARNLLTFTAPRSAFYALVNPNRVGFFDDVVSLSVITTSTVGIPTLERPRVTRLEGASPNPSRGDIRLRYALGAPGRAVLEMLDLTGRRVWSSQEGTRGPGRFEATCSPEPALPAGQYFARLLVNGRVAGTARVVMLE